MGQEILDLSSQPQPLGNEDQCAQQGAAEAGCAGSEAAEAEAREAASAKAEVLRWNALLGGHGALGSAPTRTKQQRPVRASDLCGRSDLSAGEPHWCYNQFTVRVSDAEGRFTTITLLNIRSMSRGELRRRAVELACAGRSSNLS